MSYYMGLENEFTTFERGVRDVSDARVINFERLFSRLRRKLGKVYDRSSTAVRTEQGLGFYVDGEEIEINTPPIRINKGFSSRLVDSLVIGRNLLLKSLESEVLTGYSMHWNVGAVSTNYSYDFYYPFSPVFSLLGTTPLSIGADVRDAKSGDRVEILGDSFNNEPQMRSLATLLAAYSIAYFDKDFRVPALNPVYADGDSILFVPSREQTFVVRDRLFSGQDYLERMHRALGPIIEQITTTAERQELNRVISGSLPIEADKFNQYHRYSLSKGKTDGIYRPLVGRGLPNVIVKPASRRKLPAENVLWGNLVKQRHDPNFQLSFSVLEWDNLDCSRVVTNKHSMHSDSEREDYEGFLDLGEDTLYKTLADLHPRPPAIESIDQYHSPKVFR